MKKFWIIVLVVPLIASCSKTVSEFQSQNFVKYFGGGSGAWGYDVIQLADGYVVTGYNATSNSRNQILTVRVDLAGNTRWQSQLGTLQNDEGYVVKSFGDNFYVLGRSTNATTSIVSSYLVQLSAQGDSVTTIPLGQPGYSLAVNDIAIDDNAIYVAGESYQHSTTDPDFFIAKYNHSGALQWERTIQSEGYQAFSKIFVKDNGRLILVGLREQIASEYIHTTIVEYNANLGTPVNSVTLNATDNHSFGDAILKGDALVLTFSMGQGSAPKTNLVCIDVASYVTLWEITTGFNCNPKALAFNANGLITLFGELNEAIHIYQIDKSGNIALTSQQVKALPGIASSAIATSDGGWIVVGATASDYGTMMQLVKTDTDLFLFEQ